MEAEDILIKGLEKASIEDEAESEEEEEESEESDKSDDFCPCGERLEEDEEERKGDGLCEECSNNVAIKCSACEWNIDKHTETHNEFSPDCDFLPEHRERRKYTKGLEKQFIPELAETIASYLPVETEEEDIDDEDEDGRCGAPIYSFRRMKCMEFEMAGGGSHWYWYRIIFNDNGSQNEIQRIDTHGTREVYKYQKAVIRHKDGEYNDRIKFVRMDYETRDDEYELEWTE